MGGFENFEYHLDVAPLGHKKYDEIEFSHSEMKAIFDLVVNESPNLIVTQLWLTCNMKCNFKVYEMRTLRILKKYHLHVATWGHKK
jgi:hypothetical protein